MTVITAPPLIRYGIMADGTRALPPAHIQLQQIRTPGHRHNPSIFQNHRASHHHNPAPPRDQILRHFHNPLAPYKINLRPSIYYPHRPHYLWQVYRQLTASLQKVQLIPLIQKLLGPSLPYARPPP